MVRRCRCISRRRRDVIAQRYVCTSLIEKVVGAVFIHEENILKSRFNLMQCEKSYGDARNLGSVFILAIIPLKSTLTMHLTMTYDYDKMRGMGGTSSIKKALLNQRIALLRARAAGLLGNARSQIYTGLRKRVVSSINDVCTNERGCLAKPV